MRNLSWSYFGNWEVAQKSFYISNTLRGKKEGNRFRTTNSCSVMAGKKLFDPR